MKAHAARWMIPAAAPLIALSAGALAARSLLLSLIVVLPLCFLAAGLAARHSPRLLGLYLGALLAGYAFLDRGFAYAGASPIFVGEIGLFVALFALLPAIASARLSPIHWLLLAFIGFGALRTLPFLGTYGLDAPRDGVLWAYALVALAISLAGSRGGLERAVAWYRRLLPAWLVAAPGLFVLAAVVGERLPTWPGSGGPILSIKGGDLGVHAAGAGAFLLVGLYQRAGSRASFHETLLWVPWLAVAGLAAAASRGAGVAIALGLIAGVVAARPPGPATAARAVRLSVIGGLLMLVFIIINPSLNLAPGRTFTPRQLVDNVTSIISTGSDDSAAAERQQGTKEFRLTWWGEVAHYTFNGPYFWTGKGFGVNLADDDGFQVTLDKSLRAPHNSHVTILARMGVPGLALWVALQSAFAFLLLRAIRRARAGSDPFLVQAGSWLFAMWVAMMVNTSFDPYLEGPQGGIWFWAVIGLGLLVASSAPGSPPTREQLDAHPRRP